MTKEMKEIEKALRDEGFYLESPIEGLSDLLWSMGARCITAVPDELIKWFNSPIPAFDNKVPMQILKKEGEKKLFVYMVSLPA